MLELADAALAFGVEKVDDSSLPTCRIVQSQTKVQLLKIIAR